MRHVKRDYSNGEIVIHWDSAKCTHSGICVRGLPTVFDVRRRPWIEPLAGTTDEIVAQVEKCPSGALSWSPLAAKPESDQPS